MIEIGDGLINGVTGEMMLDHIRYNPRGDSYDNEESDDTNIAGVDAAGNATGCGGGQDSTDMPITTCEGYELVSNIDLSMLGTGWRPIQDDFVATLDGNGNTISNLTINGTVTDDSDEILGFFTSIGDGGIVRNLTIAEVKITGTATSSNSRTGSLAGELKRNGEIDGVGIINTLSTSVSINVASLVGGLVGSNKFGIITNSYATVAVNSSGDRDAGGLVGYSKGSIMNSYATGAVNSSGNGDIGGLVGESALSITNSYATGAVIGARTVGGLVGYSSLSITNSYATGPVIGTRDVGGLIGSSYGSSSSITNSYATGSVIGTRNVGGLVGYFYNDDDGDSGITNSYATGVVNGSEGDIGGLVGYLDEGNIMNSYTTGSTVSGTSNVGGFIGYSGDTIITNNFVHNSYAGDRLVGNIETDPVGVSEMDLIGLTLLDTGWSGNDWAFETDKFPTLKSNAGTYPILCGQDGDHNEDGVIDWIAPPIDCPSP